MKVHKYIYVIVAKIFYQNFLLIQNYAIFTCYNYMYNFLLTMTINKMIPLYLFLLN